MCVRGSVSEEKGPEAERVELERRLAGMRLRQRRKIVREWESSSGQMDVEVAIKRAEQEMGEDDDDFLDDEELSDDEDEEGEVSDEEEEEDVEGGAAGGGKA